MKSLSKYKLVFLKLVIYYTILIKLMAALNTLTWVKRLYILPFEQITESQPIRIKMWYLRKQKWNLVLNSEFNCESCEQSQDTSVPSRSPTITNQPCVCIVAVRWWWATVRTDRMFGGLALAIWGCILHPSTPGPKSMPSPPLPLAAHSQQKRRSGGTATHIIPSWFITADKGWVNCVAGVGG